MVFLKNRLSKFTSIFDPILVPTWLHFGTKNPQKSVINRPQEASKKRSIFASIFYRFLIDFGTPLGAMLAAFSAQQGGGNESPPSFLLRSFFESIFFRIVGPRGRWGTQFLAPKPLQVRWGTPFWVDL